MQPALKNRQGHETDRGLNDLNPRQHLRTEIVFLGDEPLACVLILPVGLLKPDAIVADLLPRDQARAASLQSPGRYAEYVTSRWMLQQLPQAESAMLSDPLAIPRKGAVSHCRRWIAVAGSDRGSLGLDVESRLPRHLPEVVERLGWGALEPGQYLQAWTLWEAWRKHAGGSVLDEPDAVYAEVLTAAQNLFDAPQSIEGLVWWSLRLQGACLSLVLRP